MTDSHRLLVAIAEFDRLAHCLIGKLALHVCQPVTAFADPLLRARIPEHLQDGIIESWEYCLHGYECRFDSAAGQCVDVRLGFAESLGVLDPYFLQRFIETTAAFADLHYELGTLAAMLRALDDLACEGHLVQRTAWYQGIARCGLSLPNPILKPHARRSAPTF